MRPQVRRAAKAASKHARKTAVTVDTRPHYAVITSVDPLEAEMVGSDLVLDDDDLTLCQQVRIYDRDHTLDEGDTLVVVEMGENDWLATAVVSDKDV